MVIAVTVAALSLSACGRKGSLQAPPGDEGPPPGEASQPDNKPEESKGFLLDFLIQ